MAKKRSHLTWNEPAASNHIYIDHASSAPHHALFLLMFYFYIIICFLVAMEVVTCWIHQLSLSLQMRATIHRQRHGRLSLTSQCCATVLNSRLTNRMFQFSKGMPVYSLVHLFWGAAARSFEHRFKIWASSFTRHCLCLSYETL